MSRLLKAPEVAQILGVTLSTLSRRRAAGNFIPEINIAPRGAARPQPRFRAEDVEAYLRSRIVP